MEFGQDTGNYTPAHKKNKEIKFHDIVLMLFCSLGHLWKSIESRTSQTCITRSCDFLFFFLLFPIFSLFFFFFLPPFFFLSTSVETHFLGQIPVGAIRSHISETLQPGPAPCSVRAASETTWPSSRGATAPQPPQGKIKSTCPVPGIRDCCSLWPEPPHVLWGSMSLVGNSSAPQHELHHCSPLRHTPPLAKEGSH